MFMESGDSFQETDRGRIHLLPQSAGGFDSMVRVDRILYKGHNAFFQVKGLLTLRCSGVAASSKGRRGVD